jgi:hypothetical protein
MSYHVLVPYDALLRVMPRAAGVVREFQTTSGPYESFPIIPGHGFLAINPLAERRLRRIDLP